MAALSEEHRNLIMSDFAKAREHLILYFGIKFGHWRQLPWVCFGGAHWELEKARECIGRVLRLYAASAPGFEHFVSFLVCGSALGAAQAHLFASGQRA